MKQHIVPQAATCDPSGPISPAGPLMPWKKTNKRRRRGTLHRNVDPVLQFKLCRSIASIQITSIQCFNSDNVNLVLQFRFAHRSTQASNIDAFLYDFEIFHRNGLQSIEMIHIQKESLEENMKDALRLYQL